MILSLAILLAEITGIFPYTAKTNSPTINVKPMPAGAPPEFQGAVGDFYDEGMDGQTEYKNQRAGKSQNTDHRKR
jgi:hypothetical protein